MGTRTSLMKSPISSALMRFSMLSLTFCSWPERVWMTNHWLRMMLEFKEHEEPEENLINQDDETTEHDDGNSDHHRRALQFAPGRPSALAQFFPRLLDVVSQLLQVPLPPAVGESSTDDHSPNKQCYHTRSVTNSS